MLPEFTGLCFPTLHQRLTGPAAAAAAAGPWSRQQLLFILPSKPSPGDASLPLPLSTTPSIYPYPSLPADSLAASSILSQGRMRLIVSSGCANILGYIPGFAYTQLSELLS